MKKTYLTLIILICLLKLSHAQTNTFPASGNVGIGTTSPAYKLDVSGTVNGGASTFTSLNLNNFTSTTVAPLIVNSPSVTTGVEIGTTSTLSSILSYDRTAGAYKSMNLRGSDFQFIPSDNAAYKMALDGTGNLTIFGIVGVGTTTPLSPLHVNGNIAAAASSGSTNYYFMFQRPSDGYIGARIGNAYSFAGYGGHLVFETNDGGGPTSTVERMRITNSGNIGIGTSVPDEKLSVLGNIHANEVKVDLMVPGPDYVFDTDYKLTSLTHLKDYVAKNHHLPEMPTAEEMAKDGISLGDMNTKMLKKVEELTLYLIEKDKQLKTQEEQIMQQKAAQQAQEKRIQALEVSLAKLNK